MDDDKIFGPFTLRQFLYFAFALLVIYFEYNHFSSNISIPIAIIVAGIAFFLIRQAEPPPFNEGFIRRKRSELTKEEFQKWAQRKIAMIQSQIYMRKERGLTEDPELIKMKEMISVISQE